MKRTLASLAEVLWPVGRARILGLLLGQPDETWHLREIARRTGLAPATVQREIASLARAGILTRQRQGNQVYYQVFPELHSLALKTAGLADVLRQVLQPLGDRLGLAAVFGSLAAGTAHGDSDVDLLLIGDLTLRELSAPLAEAERTLGREINPVVMTREELQAMLTNLTGDKWLMASLMYCAGLRLMECLRLRVQDIDFSRKEILVRDGKGAKDRITMLPESLKAPLQQHLKTVKTIHERDLADG